MDFLWVEIKSSVFKVTDECYYNHQNDAWSIYSLRKFSPCIEAAWQLEVDDMYEPKAHVVSIWILWDLQIILTSEILMVQYESLYDSRTIPRSSAYAMQSAKNTILGDYFSQTWYIYMYIQLHVMKCLLGMKRMLTIWIKVRGYLQYEGYHFIGKNSTKKRIKFQNRNKWGKTLYWQEIINLLI